jgi:hypothetical protein
LGRLQVRKDIRKKIMIPTVFWARMHEQVV